MADTLGTQIRTLIAVVQSRLNSSPATADEWLAITRQLRLASDKARKITALATRMEAISTNIET